MITGGYQAFRRILCTFLLQELLSECLLLKRMLELGLLLLRAFCLFQDAQRSGLLRLLVFLF